MTKNQYKEFSYVIKNDYDKKVKFNKKDLAAYSEKKLNELYPEKDYQLFGETFENKKHKYTDIGKIELNDKRFYVTKAGKHNSFFKKKIAYLEVEGQGFIVILKKRLLPIVLIVLLLLCNVTGCLYYFSNKKNDKEEGSDIKKIDPIVLTISGTVSKDGKPLEDALLSLQKGNEEIAKAFSDEQGKYLINDVKNGYYNLVCSYGDSILTKMAILSDESIEVNFVFPADDLHDIEEIIDYHIQDDLPESKPTNDNSDVKAIVEITDDKTPAIEVDGLSKEAMLNMEVGKEVDLTLQATLLIDEEIPSNDKTNIEKISGELDMTYYDFSVLKEVFNGKQLESSEYLSNTKTVLQIAVPYDSSHSVATYVFRYHSGEAVMLTSLMEKPTTDYMDGTYFVSNDMVFIYTNCFSTYAIGAANAEQVMRGSDTITYSNQATVNLNTNKIELLYKHDAESTNTAKVEVYLVGNSSNLLIGESDEIKAGYELTGMSLISNVKGMPSVGTYEGLMKIIYLDEGGSASMSVDIPLVVAIVK